MIIVIGLVILVAAIIAGAAGVLGNGGSGHALTHPFAVFGYHVTGSTGTLFLYGIVVGAVALFGLTVLLAGARRTSRRGRAARQGLKQSRRETAAVSRDRDDLIDQREAARASTASTVGTPENGSQGVGSDPRADGGGGWSRLFGHRTTSPQASQQWAATPPAETLNNQPADVPVGAAAPADASVAAD
jgi:hypothetical protein